MFWLLTQRVYRVAQSPTTDKFAARHTSHTQWCVSGPFSNRDLAEKSAAAALGAHTCLSAQVLTEASLEALSRDHDYGRSDAASKALKLADVEETV